MIRLGSLPRLTAFAAAVFLTGLSPHAVLAAPPRHGEEAEKPVRTIAIVVNGETLDTDTPPQVVDGRLLLPLRDVFAALGIAVTRSGSSVTARLPTGSVGFQVGSSTATVDGKPVALGSPVIERDGTTFAPLTLLTAAFGAQAAYDQRGAKVEIVSAFVGRNGAAQSQRPDGGSDIQGVVSAVDLDSNPPSVTVVRGGTSRTISINSDAKIWIDDVTIHSQLHGALADVRIGDAIHAILARDGRVESVFDFYKSVGGTITALSPTSLVLASGRVVTPTSTTQITLNSAAAKLGDLMPGDYVTVRSNPESGELREIVASRALAAQLATSSPATAPSMAIASVQLSADRPLKGGESFDVVLQGTPGGRASFDIGDYLTGLDMRETQPGTYVGHYTIPDRFNVTQVPVYGRLSVGSASAPRTEAARTLSATTTPPNIGEVAPPPGQTVNNSRPSIYATYNAPTEIAINASSVSITVNGHDETSASTRTGGFITYSPGIDLPDGPVVVVVRVSDAAGNTSTKTWTFTIRTR
jgi:hypothetical protein